MTDARVNAKINKVIIDGDLVTINDISFATTAAMDLYVRDADGSDDNPGTSALPLATIQAAIDKIPLNVKHTVRIHVGPHTGSGYDPPSFKQRRLEANIWLIGDGGGGGTDGFTEIVASSVVQAGSDDLILVTTGGLSTTEFNGYGEHFGRTVEILTGTAAGDRKSIRNNDATNLYPTLPFSAALSSGDTYRIVEPETVIAVDNTVGVELVSCCGGSLFPRSQENTSYRVFFVNLKIEAADNMNLDLTSSTAVFYGVLFNESVSFDCTDGEVISGMDFYNLNDPKCAAAVADLSVAGDLSWTGWGISNRGSAASGVWIEKGRFIGAVNSGQWGMGNGSHGTFVGGSVFGYTQSAIILNLKSICEIHCTLQDIMIGVSSGGNSFGIFTPGGFLTVLCFGTATCYVKASSRAFYGSWKSIVYLLTSDSTKIDLEAGVGFYVLEQSMVTFGIQVPTCNCGGNDFTVDGGTTKYPISVITGAGIKYSNLVYGTVGRV